MSHRGARGARRRRVARGVIVLLALVVGAWLLAAAPALGTPGVPATLKLTLTPSSIPADGGTSSTNATVVVQDDTTPTPAGVAGETIKLTSTDSGQIPTSITMHDDGGGNYSATVPSSKVAGGSTITATDSAANLSDSKPLSQTAGPAQQISVQLTPTSIVADGNSTSTVSGTVADQFGNPVPNATVTFTPNTIPSVQTGSTGTYSSTYTSTTVPGTVTIKATSGSASAQKSLTQTAGPPQQTSVQLSPTSIVADGNSTSTVSGTVADQFGNPVPNATVTFTPNTIPSVQTGSTGTYSSTYTSTTVPGTVTIKATSGSASAQKSLTQTAGPPQQISVQLSPTSIVADGHSTSTVSGTVADQFGNPVPNATVTFTPSTIPTVHTATNGTYSSTYTATTTAGAVPITATSGSASAQKSLTQTAGSPQQISVQLSPTSIVADGHSTSTVSGTVADQFGNPVPNATVTFTPSTIPTVHTATNGTYSSTYTSTTIPGTVTIKASAGAASGSASLKQATFASTTTLSAVPSSAITNQTVTLIALVTAGGGSQEPKGTVTFLDNGVAIPGCVNAPLAPLQPLVSQSTCQTSFGAAVLPHRLTAEFTSSSLNTADSSGADSIAVGQSSTSTALSVTAAAPNVGSSVTFVATVTPGRAGPIAATGSVAFLDSGQPVPGCSAQTLTTAAGAATCTVKYALPGVHSITARYSGDANFVGSTSSAQGVTSVQPLVKPTGTIRATMEWTFFYSRAYSVVRVLVLNGAPVGATVGVVCQGHGCPFASHVSVIRKSQVCKSTKHRQCRGLRPGAVNLIPLLRHHHLRPGDRIVVKITERNWIGKYYQFTIRSARPPAVLIDCLAPGGAKPGAGC